jgi:hypothetical protein
MPGCLAFRRLPPAPRRLALTGLVDHGEDLLLELGQAAALGAPLRGLPTNTSVRGPPSSTDRCRSRPRIAQGRSKLRSATMKRCPARTYTPIIVNSPRGHSSSQRERSPLQSPRPRARRPGCAASRIGTEPRSIRAWHRTPVARSSSPSGSSCTVTTTTRYPFPREPGVGTRHNTMRKHRRRREGPTEVPGAHRVGGRRVWPSERLG